MSMLFATSIWQALMQFAGVIITAFVGMYTAQWKLRVEQEKKFEEQRRAEIEQEARANAEKEYENKLYKERKRNAYVDCQSLMHEVDQALKSFIKRSVQVEKNTMKTKIDKFGVETDDQQFYGASRVILLKSENGGGIPYPGCTLSTSLISEYSRDYIEDIPYWKKVPIDSEYLELLDRFVKEDYVILDIEKMPDSMRIKSIYKQRGIKSAYVQEVFRSNKGFFYVSIGFSHQFDPSQYQNMEFILDLVNKISDYYSKMADIYESFPDAAHEYI